MADESVDPFMVIPYLYPYGNEFCTLVKNGKVNGEAYRIEAAAPQDNSLAVGRET